MSKGHLFFFANKNQVNLQFELLVDGNPLTMAFNSEDKCNIITEDQCDILLKKDGFNLRVQSNKTGKILLK